MAAAGKSRPIDRVLNIFVSAAAVPVLLGALFKITHAPGADVWLKVGLYTEAAVFLAYALLYLLAPPPEDGVAAAPVAAESNSALKSMDKMLLEADITPTSLKKLGEGFNKLGTTVSGISDVSDVVKSTSDFSNKTKEATTAIGTMATAFAASANTMSSFNNASESAKGFHEQVTVMTKNLGSLNVIYENELKSSNNYLGQLNKFYGALVQASESALGSASGADTVKTETAKLAGNLSKLNSVYGNMLSAMQGR